MFTITLKLVCSYTTIKFYSPDVAGVDAEVRFGSVKDLSLLDCRYFISRLLFTILITVQFVKFIRCGS